MKKVLIIIGFVIVAVAIFFLIAFNKFQSLNSKYVNIAPGNEELIVLVNVGSGDRQYIAEKINEVGNCNPRLIGIDLFFKDYSSDSEQDSMLLSSIQNSKPILATRHQGIGTHAVNKVFLEAALDYGYAELNEEGRYVANFDVFRERNSKKDFHFAYVIAKYINPVSASDFLEKMDTNQTDIVISKLSNQFKVFDFNQPIDCEQLTGKVVIFGYLGPTNEDKFQTYARYHGKSDRKGPDMYGPIVIANQILLLLKEEI